MTTWPGRPPEPYDAAKLDRLIAADLRRRGLGAAELDTAAAVYTGRGNDEAAGWLRDGADLVRRVEDRATLEP